MSAAKLAKMVSCGYVKIICLSPVSSTLVPKAEVSYFRENRKRSVMWLLQCFRAGWRSLRRIKGRTNSSTWEHLRPHPEHIWSLWGLRLEERRTRNRNLDGAHEFHLEDSNAWSKWVCRVEEPHLQKMGGQRGQADLRAKQCRWQDEQGGTMRGSCHSSSLYKNDRSSR